MKKVAQHLEYCGNVYQYSHSKDNVMVYIDQPHHYYDDWIEDGGILIVKYRPEYNGHEYLVLHCLSVCEGNGHIVHMDIHNKNRIATPLK